MNVGYDNFNDKRLANNHQSGSDYRVLGTSSIIQGTGASTVIYPQFLGDGSTIIQWNPIRRDSEGSNFRTHSVFYNDAWRVSSRLTANLGVRYDKNNGADQAGETVITDYAWSPRLGVVFDPTGDGTWAVTGSVAKYVTAISNSIADAASAAGNPEERQFIYRGPNINPAGSTSLLTPDVALTQLFAWYNANGGANLPLNGTPIIPGVTPRISEDLRSPSVWEYATGVNRQFGNRTAVRIDATYRNYTDFYSDRADTSTGIVRDPDGRPYDLIVIENESDLVKRRYAGVTFQTTSRWSMMDIGGNYTLSRAWGNFEGETVAEGPIRFEGRRFPEYKSADWNYPEGNLLNDQRHRARLWINYRPSALGGLTLSLLQTLESGAPYGGGGRTVLAPNANSSGVDARPYVTNPGYLAPPAGNRTSYYYTERDAFHTEAQIRTDFAANYVYRPPGQQRRGAIRPGAGDQSLQSVPVVRVRRDGVWYRQRTERRRDQHPANRHDRADAGHDTRAVRRVQPVHDHAGARSELGLRSELRTRPQSLCLHDAAVAAALVRRPVLANWPGRKASRGVTGN